MQFWLAPLEAATLQWGLTHSSEETSAQAAMSVKAQRLQWGLTHSSEETITPGSPYPAVSWLQWGLTHSSEETWHAVRDADITELASMGPHSFERGNYHSLRVGISIGKSFNGASLIRARKHGMLRVN